MININEIWKVVKNYENYEVSNYGNVRHIHRRKNRKFNDNGHGYLQIGIKNEGHNVNFYLHRAVAEAFIPNPNNLPDINHKDENPYNNYVDNLEWCDTKYNCNYGNHKQKLSDARGKPVNQYTLDGKYLNTYTSPIKAETKLKIPTALVNKSARSYCMNDKCYHRTAGGFIWCYVENEINEQIKGYWKDKYYKFIA